ncbi:MAG: prolyl-tRNA synthetase associated domain-containing protein [Pseudomonadota bacterium]
MALYNEERLYADMREAGIEYAVHEHEAVFTVEESAAIKGDIRCLHTKNLFLKDAVGDFFLLTVPAEARIDLKRVPEVLGCKRLSFGKPDKMERLLEVKPGSVTPLAMINAAPGTIKFVMDFSIAGIEPIGVHPLRNTATVTLSGIDVMQLVLNWGHQPTVAELPKIQA